MSALLSSPAMINLFLVFAHILATIAKLLRSGGAKAVHGKLVIRHPHPFFEHPKYTENPPKEEWV